MTNFLLTGVTVGFLTAASPFSEDASPFLQTSPTNPTPPAVELGMVDRAVGEASESLLLAGFYTDDGYCWTSTGEVTNPNGTVIYRGTPNSCS
ncbi:hypothetical protein Ple7327_2996 [Pleurocapsa sp. PCC 7327]|uniref:hypothetical protein n=1 Tax=Pleurocapsa sp. PCC 7327 TaxID=118163 RepID=UPI00029FF4DB|nr:hypothetical protein [Pleurocapsa sp. PCC 7327]AFY78230.1 hypothetical protein Ple7327_2996 [Pleurocapsa sp. PCC 7327]